jgi:hypothetical protein
MINFFSKKVTLVLAQSAKIVCQIFRRKYFKNHNIGPRFLSPQFFQLFLRHRLKTSPGETKIRSPVTKPNKAAVAGTAASAEDPKERRSVRQNADGASKAAAPKMTPKKAANAVSLDKDSSSITDWTAAAAKPKRAPASNAPSAAAAATLAVNSVSAASIGNSLVVETNKNFAAKRIKTRSAKTSGNKMTSVGGQCYHFISI